MPKKIRISQRSLELVNYIEQESGYAIPDKARESILNELEVSILLNGEVSQGYLNNLISAYKIAAQVQKSEAANHDGLTASIAS